MSNVSPQISSMAFIYLGTKHLNESVSLKDDCFNKDWFDFAWQHVSYDKLQLAQVRVTLESSLLSNLNGPT